MGGVRSEFLSKPTADGHSPPVTGHSLFPFGAAPFAAGGHVSRLDRRLVAVPSWTIARGRHIIK
jgi:hypothetical protein